MTAPTATMTRRQALMHGAAGLTALGMAPALHAQAAPGPLANTLRIVIPANPGGGWDQTGRAIGAALVASGAARQVEYENIGGKGGTVGLEAFAKKYSSDPNAMLISGMVMVGAVALRKPDVNLTHVQPLARLSSEYLMVLVAPDSPIRNTRELTAALRDNLASMPLAGGSFGGVDHLFAGLLARSARAPMDKLVYRPYSDATAMTKALLDKQVAVGISSSYSEMSDELASGQLRAIGISSRHELFGIPSLRTQGLDAEMANWRGVLTGKNLPASRVQEMTAALKRASQHESWQRTLQNNRWVHSWAEGKNFADFLDLELSTTQVLTLLLKLKVT